MIKTLGRILIILLAVGLVAGGLYWIGQNHPTILSLGDDRLTFMEEGNRPGRGARELFENHAEAGDGLPLDFQARGIHPRNGELRLDLTRRQSHQDDILHRYGIKGVPTLLFFDAQGKEVPSLRVEEFMDKKEILQRMKKLLS